MFADFITGHYVEILGVAGSLIYLYFSVRQNIWLWPFGIISSGLFIYIFYATGFYADMGLQVYYLFISVYGWYHWVHGSSRDKGGLPVTRAAGKVLIASGGVFLVLLAVIGVLLDRLTDSTVPWGDSFTTAGSIIATWMLARKIIQHWLLWIVVDSVAAGLYLYKGLYPTTGLYIIYAGIAVAGYFQWKKSLQPT